MFLKFSSVLLYGIVLCGTLSSGRSEREPYYLTGTTEGTNGEYYDTEVEDDEFELEFPADFLIAVRKLSNILIEVLNSEKGTGRATIKKVIDEFGVLGRHPVSTNLLIEISKDVHKTLTNPTAQKVLRKIVQDALKFHQVVSLGKFDYSIRNFIDAFSEPHTMEIFSSIFNEIMYVNSSERRIEVLDALIRAAISDSKASAPVANKVNSAMRDGTSAVKPEVQPEVLNIRNFYSPKPPLESALLRSE